MKTQNLIIGTLLLAAIMVLTACTTPTGKAFMTGPDMTKAADGVSYSYYRGDADGDGSPAPGDISTMNLVVAGANSAHCYALGHGPSQTGPIVDLNCSIVLEMNNDNKVDSLDKLLLQNAVAGYEVGCGNGKCDSGENPTTCPSDCLAKTCGNNVCEPGEKEKGCADCSPDCGNGICDGKDTVINCPTECFCGDGICSKPGENKNSCPTDCSK